MYNVISTLFLPLSFLYEQAYSLRRYLYKLDIIKSSTLPIPTISVGNVALGGTGKTPFVLWLANYCHNQGLKTMVLMRGYKGNYEHSSARILPTKTIGVNASTYGDEPVLLANSASGTEVVIGKNRLNNFYKYFESSKPDVVVLDDGFQHLKIKRQIDFVLIDAELPLSKYKCLPSGYLREGLRSISDADVIIITKSEKAKKAKLIQIKDIISKHINRNTPIVMTENCPVSICYSDGREALDINNLSEESFVAFAGIASPDSFFKTLAELGAKVTSRKTFPDHHAYSHQEVLSLVNNLHDSDWLITTEKDIMKVRRVTDHKRLVYLKMDIKFAQGEEIVKKIISNIMP